MSGIEGCPGVRPAEVVESPALCGSTRGVPAFEVKFLLPEAAAREVERRLGPVLALDPHADPARGNAYQVTSVYFDTPRLDVYHRADGYRRRKYRLRRYGDGPTAFLERKSKRGQQVRKLRTEVPWGGPRETLPPAEAGPGAWFARQVAARRLGPVCRVAYERVAYVGGSAAGPCRLTFDRAARGLPASAADLGPFAGGVPLLRGEVIVEFKFLGAMPVPFKGVIEALRLAPRSCSKYRRCAGALGLVPAGGAADA